MEKLGQLMLFGIEGTKVAKEHELFLRETGLGGVILFRRNFENPKQLCRFVSDLQSAAADAGSGPLIVSVDQEGGRVARLLEPFTRVPAMQVIGRAAGEDGRVAFEVGRLVGRELSAVGINCDHAPVLDVAQALQHPHTAHREMVVDMAGGYQGLGAPVKLSRTPASYRHAPLSEGQEFLPAEAETGRK